MNHFDSNKLEKVVWTQGDSTQKDTSDRPQGDDADIIPFPARPAPDRQVATLGTGANLITLSIRKILRRTREQVLNHIRMTGKPANGQGYGKGTGSATAVRRAAG
jgi:hypothetical protein